MDEAAGRDGARTGGYAWYALGVMSVVYMLNFIDRQILSILAEDIKADLQLTDAQLGFLYGTAFTIMFTVLPRLGVVGNSAIMNVEPVFALALAWLILLEVRGGGAGTPARAGAPPEFLVLLLEAGRFATYVGLIKVEGWSIAEACSV